MGQGRGRKLVTEEPKPVGSGEIIYSSFYYKYNFCSFTSQSPPCAGSLVSAFPNTLFMAALPIPSLHLYSALRGLQFVLFSQHSRTDRPSSQHKPAEPSRLFSRCSYVVSSVVRGLPPISTIATHC